MEKIEELLPGIEHFLYDVLAKEKLSSDAEERCKYYVERLEILKLPPTIPPRPKPEEVSESKPEESENHPITNHAAAITKGEKHRPNGVLLPIQVKKNKQGRLNGKPCLPPRDRELNRAKKYNSAPVQGNETEVAVQTSDFAAFQRALARSLATPDSVDTENSDSEEGKVYDDIDNSIHGDEMEDEECEEADLYEIPVTQTCDESPQSVEPIIRVIHCGNADDASSEEAASPQPRKPPLPPRKETVSDPLPSTQDSGSSQHKALPPQLPVRPQLATRSEIYAMTSEKSEHTDDNTDEELTSYESNDIEHDFELLSKLSIKLPKTLKKIKKMKNGRKSHSSSQWNLAQPFKSLEDVVISGELQLKRKLTWNKRLVAISAGRLICYKSEREPRPGLVITLTGYDVSCTEREGRRGYELKLTHPMSDTYHFAVECKDWAQTWTEVIKCVAESKPVPCRPHHLTRAFSGQSDSGMGSRNDVRDSGSNLSNVSSEKGSSHEENLHRRTFIDDLGIEKSNHLGSLASRASHFLETLARKRQSRKPSELKLSRLSLNSSPKKRQSTPSSETSPEAVVSEKLGILNEDGRWQEINIKCKSYLNVYSSFNKRPWGKRWCLVKLHTFECYQNHNSNICEMNFMLKDCVVRWAKKETKSDLGLMILNNNIEKITVEALNEMDMRNWLSVLMEETATEVVPEGLAQYFTEQPYSDITINRQSSIKFFRPRENNYESCDQNILEDNVFSEELEDEAEVSTNEKRKEEALKKNPNEIINKESFGNVTDSIAFEEPEDNKALKPQNGQSETPDKNGAKPVSGRSSAISAAKFSEYLQEITETCSTGSTTSDRNSGTPLSSLASPEKSSGTDVSTDNLDPLYSWNPQYRSSELLSEKDIEALMQSWSVKNKIFMLEEKHYADVHSKPERSQNGSARRSAGAVSSAPTNKLFVSTSKSANYLSRFALDNEEDELDAPTNNHNCLHTPTQNISSNGFSVDQFHCSKSSPPPSHHHQQQQHNHHPRPRPQFDDQIYSIQEQLDDLRSKLFLLKQKRMSLSSCGHECLMNEKDCCQLGGCSVVGSETKGTKKPDCEMMNERKTNCCVTKRRRKNKKKDEKTPP